MNFKNFDMSIKNKLFILFILVIVIAVSSVGWFGFQNARDSYINSAIIVNKGETKALSNEIKGILGTIPDDVIYNANFYALQKLLVWEDLEERKKINYWHSVYLSSLKNYLFNKKLYYQIRILDTKGNEKILLKFDERTNTIVQEKDHDLQNKANRDYFKKAIDLKKGEFYISDMNLNIEHGQIEKPYVPVVRYASPIVDANGQTKGVIVLNLNANTILETIASTKSIDKTRDVQRYYLLNEDGYYLFIGDKTKRWGFQLGTDYNFKKDYKDVMEKFKEKDEITFIKNDKVFSMHKIYPNKGENKYRFWYLVTVIDKNVALVSLDRFASVFFLILATVLILGLILINGYISKLINPLTKVTSQLKALSKGEIKKEDISYGSNDEVGQIVNSTSILVNAIENTINQANSVSNGDFTKDIELLSQNDKLGLALTGMTNRLKEITTLAKSLSSGNYDVKVVVKDSNDELGLALASMVEYLETITNLAESISEGEIDQKYKAKGEDDRLGYAILRMIKYLKSVLNQANAISKEDFTHNIEPKSKNDELGIALVTMTDLLRQNATKTKNEIWFSEGLGEFSDSLTGIEDISTLSKTAITKLSRYIDASSSVLYRFDSDNEKLHMIASYSFVDRDNLANSFDMGEGIIGQVALEKEPILLKNIKDSSFEVQTGTTASKPKEVFAFPLVHENELFGVIEVMSFENFTQLQKDYLLKTGVIFATAMHTTSQNEQIKVLLEESQKAYEELQVKSEEMQSQSEELRTTNEQMEEQQQQLEMQSANLKIKNVEIEKAKEEIDKRAKELEVSNQYKSEFLANMSHELRTPLNSVILLSSLLSKNPNENLNGEDIQKAKVINQSGNELLRLINDILDLSKIESGKMQLLVDKIDTQELSSNYYELFTHSAKENGLEFKVEDNYQGEFYNDKDRLGQIIRNLVSNALKFTKDGTITLCIDKNDDMKLPVKLSVKDTGIGIPKEKQDLIFKAFMQADGSTSRQYGGTGLGLSITKELTHLMNGRVELESIEGVGSTFSIYLPSLESDYDSSVDLGPKKLKEETTILNKKVDTKKALEQFLIVEDDEIFSKTLKIAVQENNADAHIANSAKEALELLSKYKFSGAIIDIGLPDLNGIELIKKIKDNPLTTNMHIQVISGLDEDSVDLEDLKIDGYLQKPVSNDQINNAIINIEKNIEKDLKSILIVEDDKIHLKAIQDYIQEDSELDIKTASSVHSAKELCSENYFDLAIVDLGLIDGKGEEVCKYINETTPQTAILIYTGRDISYDEVDFLNNISDEIIIKNPNSHERLKDEVNRFLTSLGTTVNSRVKVNLDNVQLDPKNILSGKNALIVDDDMKNIFVLSSALQEQKMNIAHAKNGKEALEYLKENPDTDIVLMDIMMPVMNGYEATKAIREDENLKHLPVIAVTAKAMAKDKEEAIKNGADDYMTKPIDLDKLVGMLNMWINKNDR